jgi:hypothetical protein
MTETLMTAFTAVLAVSTIAYTIATFKLWKATKASVDAARASVDAARASVDVAKTSADAARTSADAAKVTVLLDYLAMLAREIEKNQATNPQAAAFLQQVGMLLTEFAFSRFLDDIKLDEQPRVRDALNQLAGLFRAHGIDPQNIPWFRPVLEKMKPLQPAQ